MTRKETKKTKSHKDLDLWNKSMALVEEVYSLTNQFPKSEIYGLTSQIRRSAISIPSNVAEGAARNSKKEFIQFLYIAMGSLSEMETQLILAKRLNYLNKITIIDKVDAIRKMIVGLINFLKK